MGKCGACCFPNYQGKWSTITFFTLLKVKPLSNINIAKVREGNLKAVINNKQRMAWLNAIKKSLSIGINLSIEVEHLNAI